MGYGHADEQLYSPVYFDNPHLFAHYYGDYQQMITNYVYAYECSDKIIIHFIRNSFTNKNYAKCFEACEFLIQSLKLKICQFSDEYLRELGYYHLICKLNT